MSLNNAFLRLQSAWKNGSDVQNALSLTMDATSRANGDALNTMLMNILLLKLYKGGS